TADAAVVATDAAVVEAAAAVIAAAIAVRARRGIDNSYQNVGASRLCIKIFVSNEIAQDEATTARASSDVLLKTQTEERYARRIHRKFSAEEGATKRKHHDSANF
ncbi:MAG TPA: hypothetical protein VFR76_09515, partial [Verrucomicrobiae bacterium]|nr:hypothetical protein [Verrucomicrobiae bacterium]